MVLNFKFKIGEIVYFKTCQDQDEYMITGYKVTPNAILYYVSLKGYETLVYDIEITNTKDVLKSLNINSEENEIQ
jgi:hypothetical protein